MKEILKYNAFVVSHLRHLSWSCLWSPRRNSSTPLRFAFTFISIQYETSQVRIRTAFFSVGLTYPKNESSKNLGPLFFAFVS